MAMMVLSFGGCATKNSAMYQWGGYDAKLYQAYKSPEKSVELRIMLEQHIAAMDQSKQKVAPGLFAELGTLYYQAGDSIRAREMYVRERNAWPENGVKNTANDFPASPGAVERLRWLTRA